jgi:hypothetical protein
MAVNLQDKDDRARIATTVRHAYEAGSDGRDTRKRLIDTYADFRSPKYAYLSKQRRQLVNYFQQFVRGRLTTLSASSPKWAVKARAEQGRGFDRRIELMLNRYSEILGMHSLFAACALDSSFGRSIIKVVTSVAPKGVTSPVAPRAFRISPDSFFVDRATLSGNYDDATFMGDVYWVPLEEAKGFEGFDRKARKELSEHNNVSSDHRLPDQEVSSDRELFIEPMTRLVDVYFPTTGEIATWESHTDRFEDIGSKPPLQVIETPINPYTVFASISMPNSLDEFAPLTLIEELHWLANDMLFKAGEQARSSRRHPIGDRSADEDMNALLSAEDNEPVFVDDLEKIGLYSIPGPDGSLISLMSVAGQLLSSSAGNLEVALGQSTGASTARQTNALLGQINTVQALDRGGFEFFMSEVARKLATLAFQDEAFALEVLVPVPGTSYHFNLDWAPPHLLPRTADINNFHFEVVPYSASFRSPQERLAQLQQASQMLAQFMGLAAQGAPINLEAILTSLEESFDLVGDLRDWWSGEPPPSPAERTTSTYTSAAAPSQGSVNQYQSDSPVNAGGGGEAAFSPAQGGIQTPQL